MQTIEWTASDILDLLTVMDDVMEHKPCLKLLDAPHISQAWWVDHRNRTVLYHPYIWTLPKMTDEIAAGWMAMACCSQLLYDIRREDRLPTMDPREQFATVWDEIEKKAGYSFLPPQTLRDAEKDLVHFYHVTFDDYPRKPPVKRIQICSTSTLCSFSSLSNAVDAPMDSIAAILCCGDPVNEARMSHIPQKLVLQMEPTERSPYALSRKALLDAVDFLNHLGPKTDTLLVGDNCRNKYARGLAAAICRRYGKNELPLWLCATITPDIQTYDAASRVFGVSLEDRSVYLRLAQRDHLSAGQYDSSFVQM